MKRGCMQRNSRKEGPDVWQFRWSETRLDGKRLYHKKIVGTVEQYPDEDAARRSVVGLLSELSTDGRPTNSGTMTVAQLCDHFEQRELPKENTWRSHATKKIYKAYLTRWIRPHWQKYGLAEVRTIQVESWLRGLPLAKSSCAKIRNLMSVLFNHACRYELFDRNPIYLVRQSAKRRTPPATLVPAEIKALIDGLALRERTLVLLCRINRVAAERDIRPKVGRYRLRAGHDERHPFHRVRSGRPVQDRIIAKASANASDSRGRSDAVEKTLYLHQAGGLGFCKQALSRPKTVLGPGDLAQIHTSCSSTSRNSEAIRMAYVPSHLLDLAAKRGD